MKRCEFLSMVEITMITWLLLLAGCTVSGPTPTPSGEGLSAASTLAVSRISSTPLPLTATPTPSVTPILMPTPGITLTLTTQPTATEIPVAIPTPPEDEIKQQVLWLFETNNGCRLPCWWGITPGQTEWATAEAFLQRFAQVIYRTFPTPELASYEVTIPLPTEVFIEERTRLRIVARNGVVEFMDIGFPLGYTPPPGYLAQHTLSPFLTTYGQPAEVWVSTYRAPYGPNDLPFAVVLFYPDQGIAASYIANGARQEALVRGCPQQRPLGFLSLWYAPLDLTFEEMKSGAAVYNTDYLPLEEATTMDVTTFYETFKEPDNTTCLETPAELWP